MQREPKDHLSGLPAGLRDRIWVNVLPREEEISPLRDRTSSSALFAVSSLIRTEALAVFLSANVFTFSFFADADVDRFRGWWDTLGQSARYIRQLKIIGVRTQWSCRHERTESCCIVQRITLPTLRGVDSVAVDGAAMHPATVEDESGGVLWAAVWVYDAECLKEKLQLVTQQCAEDCWRKYCQHVRDTLTGFIQDRNYDLSDECILWT